jgi:predicted Zn-dependent protease with MMP-like domain
MEEEFEKFVSMAVEALPGEFKSQLDNVNLFIEDFPTPLQAQKFRLREDRKMLLGLYEGVPKTKRGSGYGIGGQLPDRITLFRHPILMVARSQDHLKQLIQETLFHEIGHHFGMSEEDIESARKKNNKASNINH